VSPRRRRSPRRQRRPRGSILQVGVDRWQIRWFCGKDPVTQTRRYKARTVRGTRVEALQALAQVVAETQGEIATSRHLTVQNFFATWLTEVVKRKATRKTFHSYSEMIAPLLDSVGAVRLDKLESADLQTYYTDLAARGLSPRTIRYVHTIIKSALSYAEHSQLITRNPAKGPAITMPRIIRRVPTVWSVEQMNTFLEAVKAHPRLKQDYLLWFTLFHTGLRPGEAFGLQWRDLSGRRASIQRAVSEAAPGEYELKEPKTERSRRAIVLTQDNAALLAAERASRITEPATAHIFRAFGAGEKGAKPKYPHDNRTSARLRFASALGTINRARAEAELEPLPIIRLYDTRHTHATALLSTGIHPKVVADRLGHTSVVITLDTYSSVLPSLQEDALGAYERIFTPKNEG
jgi:integrase